MNNGRRVELDVTYNNAPFAGQVGAEIESLTMLTMPPTTATA